MVPFGATGVAVGVLLGPALPMGVLVGLGVAVGLLPQATRSAARMIVRERRVRRELGRCARIVV